MDFIPGEGQFRFRFGLVDKGSDVHYRMGYWRANWFFRYPCWNENNTISLVELIIILDLISE